jgi:hypothetical protein
MVIESQIRKLIFGPVKENIINLNDDNVEVYDVSFCPSYFQEEEEGYHCDDDYMTLVLSDVGLTLSFNVEISYSFVESYEPGDYWNPPYSEVVDESIDIYVSDLTIYDEEDNELDVDFKTKNIYNKLNEFVLDYINSNL